MTKQKITIIKRICKEYGFEYITDDIYETSRWGYKPSAIIKKDEKYYSVCEYDTIVIGNSLSIEKKSSREMIEAVYYEDEDYNYWHEITEDELEDLKKELEI